MKPAVSIIIPVHNGSNFLRDAISSALLQSHCEVLVVNDGSDDNGATEAIAQSFGNRIRYYRKERGGVGSALNLGLEKMQGRFFSWLSHDDMYLPHKIASQLVIADALSPADQEKLFLFAGYQAINIRGKKLFSYLPDCALVRRGPLFAVFLHMINGCTTLISRKLMLAAGGFANLPTTQDYEMWFRLLHMTCPICQPEPVLLSRLHPGQGFRSPAARMEAQDTFISLLSKLTEDDFRSCGCSREEFFATVGRSMCEIDMPRVNAYAWSQAAPEARVRYRRSPKRLLKLFLNKCGLLGPLRKLRGRI